MTAISPGVARCFSPGYQQHFRPREPAARPLSPCERRIATLLALPNPPSNRDIATVLGWQPKSVAICIERMAAFKVPGTLPPRVRVMLWARGAPRVVLDGWLVVSPASSETGGTTSTVPLPPTRAVP